MAGGDDNACHGLLVDNIVRDGGGGGIGAGQPGDDAVASQHSGHLGCVTVGQETGVEADNDFGFIGVCLIQHVVGDGLGHQLQVGKSKSVAYDGTPAVCTKLDGHK